MKCSLSQSKYMELVSFHFTPFHWEDTCFSLSLSLSASAMFIVSLLLIQLNACFAKLSLYLALVSRYERIPLALPLLTLNMIIWQYMKHPLPFQIHIHIHVQMYLSNTMYFPSHTLLFFFHLAVNYSLLKQLSPSFDSAFSTMSLNSRSTFHTISLTAVRALFFQLAHEVR